QTTLVPAGGCAIVEFTAEMPGPDIMEDHSLFRALNKEALAMMRPEGDEDGAAYSGKQRDDVYYPEGSSIQIIQTKDAPKPPVAKNKAERVAMGKRLYEQNCMACHQPDGQGIVGAFPPLAKSDFLNADKKRAISA